jgi:hypothetical protein
MKQGSNSHISLRTAGSLASSKCSMCWPLSRGEEEWRKQLGCYHVVWYRKDKDTVLHSVPSSTHHSSQPHTQQISTPRAWLPLNTLLTWDSVFVERPPQKGWTKTTTQVQSSRHPEKQPKPMVVNFIIWIMYVSPDKIIISSVRTIYLQKWVS